MKKGVNLRFVPIYILTFALFLFVGAGTSAVLIAADADLNILCWFIPVLAVFCIAFALGTYFFFSRIKKSYDSSFNQILTAFSSDKTEALMSVNNGEPTPEQLSRWVIEQTRASDNAAALMSVISAQQELSSEIFWQLTDTSSNIRYGSYWSQLYGYNDLDKSNNIRTLLSADTRADFDHALRSFKEGKSKSFTITGDLNLQPQKSVKVIIKGRPVKDEGGSITAVGTVHDIQEEIELNNSVQSEKIKKQFLLDNEKDVIYEVDVAENKLVCTTPETAKKLFGFGSMSDFDGERRPFWDRIHPDYREGFVDRFFDYNHMMIMPGRKMTHEYKIKNSAGDYIWVEHEAQVTGTRHGSVVSVIGRISDISDRKEEEFRSRYQTNNDSLTGAYLRSAVETEFNASLEDGEIKGVVVFNVNNFHFINNEYGFEYGDLVLKYIVGVLWDRQRGICAVGRVDNDTFVIAMTEAGDRRGWPKNQIVDVLNAFSQPVKIDGRMINITLTAGGSSPSSTLDFNALYAQAEAALKKCRENNGRLENAYELYREDMDRS